MVPMTRPLSLRITSANRAPLAGLFSASTGGALYDVSDLSSLFQDAACTVPVTAAGQPVGCMVDLSGKGNHAIQSTAGYRPLYQTDGISHWLAFDGVDDRLTTSIAPSSSAYLTAAVGVQKTSTARATVLDGGGAPRVSIEVPSFSGEDFQGFLWTDLSNNVSVRTQAPLVDTATLIVQCDMSLGHIQMNVNDDPPKAATASSASGLPFPSGYTIGARSSGALFFGGRLYAMVLLDRVLSGSEYSSLKAFLAPRTPVS